MFIHLMGAARRLPGKLTFDIFQDLEINLVPHEEP